MQQLTVQFRVFFYICLKNGDGSGTFRNGDREFKRAGAVILNALDSS